MKGIYLYQCLSEIVRYKKMERAFFFLSIIVPGRATHSIIDFLSQGIPTLIIAVSGIDDAASVAVHGIIQSIMFFPNAILWYQILQGPIAIVGGLGFGVLWGWLAKYVPEKGDVSNLIFLSTFLFSFFNRRQLIDRAFLFFSFIDEHKNKKLFE